MIPAPAPSLSGWYSARTSSDSQETVGLLDYILSTTPGYLTPPHILDIIDFLERLQRREFDRGIVVLPPRHGKSLTISQRFPAWWFGQDPRAEIIHASYAAELVHTFGRRIRNVMASEAHRTAFPRSGLSGDSTAAHRFDLEEGGSYVAAGVGGGITGRGADLLLIDDPFRGSADADSEIYRDRCWDWYLNDAMTRLLPGGVVLLVTTRWHEDDLAGRLLAEQEEGGEKWEVLHRKAIDEHGEALWPERYPVEALDRVRKRNTRTWQALFQGSPAPDQGTYFERGWFRRGVMPPPSEMRLYGASDYARSESKKSDYTVHIVIGIDELERMWLVDMWRRQRKPDKWAEAMISMMGKWQPVFWLEERGPIEKTVSPFITKAMAEREVYVRRFQLSSIQDKEARARGIQARMAHRGLHIPQDSEHAAAVMKELLSFPAGATDDIVDTLGLFGRVSAALVPPRADRQQKRAVGDGLTYDKLISMEAHRLGRKRRGW